VHTQRQTRIHLSASLGTKFTADELLLNISGRLPSLTVAASSLLLMLTFLHSFLAACEIYTTRMTVTFYWSIHVCVYVLVFLEIRHSWLYWWNWNLWNCNFCWWACSICPLNFLALFTTYKDVSMMFVGLDESAYIPVIGADNSWKWYWDIPIIRYWGMFIRRLLEMLCMWYWLTFFCSLYSGSTSSMCSASMQPSFLSDIYNHPNGFLTQMILTKKRNSIILVEQ